MASRPIIAPMPVIVNGAMTGNLTSIVSVVQNLSMMAYAYSWSGTSPVGSIVVEVSNDYSQNGDGSVNNAGTWNALPLSVSASVSGNTGTGLVDIDQLGAYAIRTRYVFTSGTGVLQATLNAKVA